MPAVPRPPRRTERAGELGGQTVPLPVRVAAGERDGAFVAELDERLGREGRTVAGCAVEDDRARAVRRRLVDPRLEVAPRNVDRTRNSPLLPFVALADVDQQRAFVDERLRARRVSFLDLRLGGLQQISVRRHRFRLYSEEDGFQRAAMFVR